MYHWNIRITMRRHFLQHLQHQLLSATRQAGNPFAGHQQPQQSAHILEASSIAHGTAKVQTAHCLAQPIESGNLARASYRDVAVRRNIRLERFIARPINAQMWLWLMKAYIGSTRKISTETGVLPVITAINHHSNISTTPISINITRIYFGGLNARVRPKITCVSTYK